MHSITRWTATVGVVVCVSLSLTACGQPPSSTSKAEEPAKIEPIGDTGVKRLTLTDKAVVRLAISTAPVTEERTAAGGGQTESARLLIPYSALLYLPDGTTFTYTNPDGNSYVREPVTVEAIRGVEAVLTAGPKVGTAVVTVGATELWGTEFGIK